MSTIGETPQPMYSLCHQCDDLLLTEDAQNADDDKLFCTEFCYNEYLKEGEL